MVLQNQKGGTNMNNINENNRLNYYSSLKNFDTFLVLIRDYALDEKNNVDFDVLDTALHALVDCVHATDPVTQELQHIGEELWNILVDTGNVPSTTVLKYINTLKQKSAKFLIIN